MPKFIKLPTWDGQARILALKHIVSLESEIGGKEGHIEGTTIMTTFGQPTIWTPLPIEEVEKLLIKSAL